MDTYEIAKKLMNNSLKALFNLMLKREHLSAENKRLLEKSAKIDAMIEALVAQSADQADIDDVKSMMNLEELNSLNKITDRCNKLALVSKNSNLQKEVASRTRIRVHVPRYEKPLSFQNSKTNFLLPF